MKVLFIKAEKKFNKIEIPKNLSNLPQKIHMLYTIQYKKLAEKLKKKIEKKNRVVGFQQILGCSKIKLKASPLLIGSGTFHALSLLNQNKELKEIFIYDGKIRKINKKQIEKIKKKKKAKISRFLASENIGLLFSKKPGQNKLKEAAKIKTKLETKFKDKNFYIFIFDTLNIRELENFNIEFWINLACPGIQLDSNNILNYEKNLRFF